MGESSRNLARRIFTAQVVTIVLMVLLLNAGYYWRETVRNLDGHHRTARDMLLYDARVWYLWALTAPAMLWLIRTTPLSKDRWLQATAKLVGCSLLIYLAVTNTRFLIRIVTHTWPSNETPGPNWNNYLRNETFLLPLDMLTYCGFFAASFAIDSYFKYRQRADEVMRLQIQAVQLQAELTRAQLASLQGQLQPHFLFNAFNAIAMLVRQGETAFAADMIARVSELLRMAMAHGDLPELPLEREFHFATCYLEVEQVRFSDKLRTKIELAPAARRCLVPNLLLQPLVENAVKHGISRRTAPGLVHLRADRAGDRLQVELTDDGPGAAPAPDPAGTGIGLSNTRSRLDLAYGSDYRLDITRRPAGGTSVRLDLPWREKSTGAAR